MTKTNLVVKASDSLPRTENDPAAPDVEEEEEKAPQVDPVLAEAQHVLRDYISLLNTANIASTGTSPQVAPSPGSGTTATTTTR